MAYTDAEYQEWLAQGGSSSGMGLGDFLEEKKRRGRQTGTILSMSHRNWRDPGGPDPGYLEDRTAPAGTSRGISITAADFDRRFSPAEESAVTSTFGGGITPESMMEWDPEIIKLRRRALIQQLQRESASPGTRYGVGAGRIGGGSGYTVGPSIAQQALDFQKRQYEDAQWAAKIKR